MFFVVTKVTYNTYSCVISGMSREMMKIKSRDSAECQNWEKNDIYGIFEILNDNRTKTQIVSSPTYEKGREKRGGKEKSDMRLYILVLERVCGFSLDLREIRPSAVFGTRRKVALCGEGFAWVSDLRSLDKLLEVGVSPYLGFILCLRSMLMLELVEAVRGRLICRKTWNRIVWIYGTQIYSP